MSHCPDQGIFWGNLECATGKQRSRESKQPDSRKDPVKKRKGSPVATFGNFKIAKNLTHQNISRSNDLINDNLEEISSLSKIQSKLSLEFSDSEDDIFSAESKACKDIQQGIEFSDSEEEN